MKERVSMIFTGWWCLVTKLCPALVTSGSIAPWAPLFMGFPRQEHCSGLPFPTPGDLPNPGIGPISSALAAGFFTPEPPGKPMIFIKSKMM